MGMYDNVKGAFMCPKCGHMNTNFQTKEHSCSLNTLDYRSCDYFYTHCEACGIWLDVVLKDDSFERLIEMRRSFTEDDYNVIARRDHSEYEKSKEIKTKIPNNDEGKKEVA